MGSVNPAGVYVYDGLDQVTPLQTLLNLQASALTDTLTGIQNSLTDVENSLAEVFAARRSGTSGGSIPSGSVTNFNPGNFEYNYGMSGSGGKINIPVSGIYSVGAGVRWDSGLTGVTQLRVVGNGGTSLMVDSQSVSQGGSGSQHTNSVAGTLKLDAGDSLGLSLFQNSGSSAALSGGFGMPFFVVTLQHRLP